MEISVRECLEEDIEKIVDYFLKSDAEYLRGMGADKNKLLARNEWIKKLQQEFKKPYAEKELYYIIWLLDNEAVGHSNVNHIKFGEVATMHLHVWNSKLRQNGLGSKFLKKTIPLYFENLKLEKLICEPFSGNISPNKTLRKIGFDFIKNYETIPGAINFYQEVSRYEITKGDFEKIF